MLRQDEKKNSTPSALEQLEWPSSVTNLFLNLVLAKTKKQFKNGYQINQALKENALLEKNKELREKFFKICGCSICDTTDYCKHMWMRFKDDFACLQTNEFNSYTANSIPQANFIAARGPQGLTELKDYLDKVVMTQKQSSVPIVTFAEAVFKKNEDLQGDFYDYCVGEDCYEVDNYIINVKRLEGMPEELSSPNQLSLCLNAKSTVFVIDTKSNKEKQLEVTTLALTDNFAIDLFDKDKCHWPPVEVTLKEKEMSPTNYRLLTIQWLWEIFVRSLKETILVHCSRGVGRTGHFILTMLILKHFNRIFGQVDADKAAKEIITLLENIRAIRPGFIVTDTQFVCSIKNAVALYRFALEKKYIHANFATHSTLVSEVNRTLPTSTNDFASSAHTTLNIFASNQNAQQNEILSEEVVQTNKVGPGA